MFQSYQINQPCRETLLAGLHSIVSEVSLSYGNEGELIFRDGAGNVHVAKNAGTFLRKAKLEDQQAEYARTLIAKTEPAEDGMKTALILASDLLGRMQAGAVSAEEVTRTLPEITAFSKQILFGIAENCGVLPGGGLYLLSLARPLMQLCDQGGVAAAGVAASAMSSPLKVLAESNGFVFHEVYERVKAAAPNQFYSLHHFGIEGSIPVNRQRLDGITIGVDLRSKKLADLPEAGITVSLETGFAILDKTAEIIQAFLSVKSIF